MSDKKDKYVEGDSSVRPQGLMVFIMMTDGSVRNAQITEEEHARSIFHILTLNEKKGLILSPTDFAPALKALMEQEPPPKKEEKGNGKPG